MQEHQHHILDPLHAMQKSVYVVETNRAWWDRQLDHTKAIRTMDNTYATVKHHKECHLEEARKHQHHELSFHMPRFT